MNIYRIEHAAWKCGPYAAGTVEYNGKIDYFDYAHPSPMEDGISYPHPDEFFGFAKMRQLVKWFRLRDIFTWRKKGFRVYRYRIDKSHVRLGNTQAAFTRKLAYAKVEVPLSVLARHVCLSRLGS